MNNILQYIKAIASISLFVILLMLPSQSYAFDYDAPILSVTNFLNSLSYRYKEFDVKLKQVSVGERFDDNITFVKDDKKEDFITFTGIGFALNYARKTMTLEMTGNITNLHYAKNSVLDNIMEDNTIKFDYQLSEYDRVRLNDVFLHSQTPLFLGSTAFQQEFGRITGQVSDYIRNDLTIDYSREISRQLTIIGGYENSLNIFTAENLGNSVLNNPGIEINYLFSTSTIFVSKYNFINRRFDDGKDASINELTAGIKYYISKKLHFDCNGGGDFVNTFDDTFFIKPVFNTSVVYEIDLNTSASLEFSKKSETTPYVEDVFNRWYTSVNFKRQLLDRLNCILSIFYGEGKYATFGTEQKFLGANPTLSYDITKNLKGNFTYTYSKYDSVSNTGSTGGYTKNTIFLGLSAEF